MAAQNQPISAPTSTSADASFFTEAELRLLSAICDTLMPAIAEQVASNKEN